MFKELVTLIIKTTTIISCSKKLSPFAIQQKNSAVDLTASGEGTQ